MLTIFFAYLMSMSANAQVRTAPVEGQYQAKGEYQYLTTSADYLGNSSSGLLNVQRYTRMLGVGEATYDYSPAVRFWAGFSGGQSTATVFDNSGFNAFNTVTKTNTNSGLNEGYLGAQWWTETGAAGQKFDIVPQIDFVFPFWRVNTATSNPNPLLGEGAMQFRAGSWAMYPMHEFTPFIYGGVTYRDEGRSMLLPYSVGARYAQQGTFWVQAELRGYQSLTDDSNVNNGATRDLFLMQADGGSYEFYSLNPSRAELAGLVGIQLDQFEIYAGGSKTVFGKNSADDYQFQVGITFSGRMFAKAPAKSLPAEDFSEKPEKYDDGLFKEQITPDPVQEDVPEVITPAPAPAPARPKPKKKVKPKADAPMPNVELLMKDTQKNLEKKAH